MFGLLSQNPKYSVMAIENGGGGSGGSNFLSNGNSGLSNVSSTVAVTNVSKPAFDFDISQINTAAAKGKGSVADIKSAYELFSTGQTSGRAYGYAIDIQRRFSPGLIATYGAADIRTAAANYLDSVGLPRLAQIVSPVTKITETTTTPFKEIDNSDQTFFPLPVNETKTTSTTVMERNPFEILADIIPDLFGNAVYNPPLQQQASGFTGIEQGTPLAEATGGSNIGTFIIIGIVGIIGYFLYKRFVS